MDIQGQGIFSVICVPDLAEKLLAIDHLSFLVNEHFQEIGHSGGDVFFFLITADDLALYIELDGAGFEQVFPIRGSIRDDPVF